MTGAAAREGGRRLFRADSLAVAVFALLGLWRGLWPIADNSAFTHLATGMRMVRDGLIPAIPRVDPYTFTAHGHEWVVQSWLASFAVGWADRLGGGHAVVVLNGLTMGVLAWLVASLARTGRAWRTAAAASIALLVGAPTWAPRPLLVGLLCLGLLILCVERRWAPWWLVPIVWVWVNSHGSFPLGLAWLVLVTAGAWLDKRQDDVPLHYLGAFAVGLIASVANPLGPKLLWFPATALQKREVFSHIVEWQSPDFQSSTGVVMLAGLVLAGLVLARGRLTWRDALPVAVFVGLGLSGERNMAPLGVVLAPVLGRALADAAEPAYVAADRFRVVVTGLAVAGLFTAAFAVQNDAFATTNYPVASVRWLEQHDRFDAPHRVATLDFVGNYLELLHGARGEVFVDDRADMFPLSVERDFRAMREGTDRGVRALDRWDIDTVLWRSGEVFPQRLTANGGWVVADRQKGWVVLTRRSD